MRGPLNGVRVLDMTSVLLGPFATQILGDMGADVIKIESPAGDVTRYVPPQRHRQMSFMFLCANRNKRSVVLDLKTAEGRQAMLRLARTADVLVYSVRPAAMARLGLDYESLKAENQRLIHCGAYGFSERGPYRGRPAYDDIIQAACGIAALQRNSDGEPRYANTVLADKTVGLHVLAAITMALYERERSGEGQAIEVPMFETMVPFMMLEHLAGATFSPSEGEMGYRRLMVEHRRPYATRDGFIGILPYTRDQWQRFFRIAGREEMINDPRVLDAETRSRKVGELYAMVAEIMPTRTTREWRRLLEENDIPHMPVNELEDLLSDPHLQAIDFIKEVEHPSEGRLRTFDVPMTFSRTPGGIARLAPRLGEHTREVLMELAGYGADEVEALTASGAIGVAPQSSGTSSRGGSGGE